MQGRQSSAAATAYCTRRAAHRVHFQPAVLTLAKAAGLGHPPPPPPSLSAAAALLATPPVPALCPVGDASKPLKPLLRLVRSGASSSSEVCCVGGSLAEAPRSPAMWVCKLGLQEACDRRGAMCKPAGSPGQRTPPPGGRHHVGISDGRQLSYSRAPLPRDPSPSPMRRV